MGLLPFARLAEALPQFPRAAAVPQMGLLAGHLGRQILAFQPGPFGQRIAKRIPVEHAAGAMGDHRAGGAFAADQPGERARIDAGQADQALARHPRVEARLLPEIAGRGHILAHQTAERMGAVRLLIFLVRADIADMREGEIDDLPGIAGVGHHLLIAGHGGVKAQLAHAHALSAEAFAPDRAAIGQQQQARGAGRCIGNAGVGHGENHPLFGFSAGVRWPRITRRRTEG